jgi:hypothetical protein
MVTELSRIETIEYISGKPLMTDDEQAHQRIHCNYMALASAIKQQDIESWERFEAWIFLVNLL